jgi:hypothetical protein
MVACNFLGKSWPRNTDGEASMSILDKDSAMEDHWSHLTEDILYDRMKAPLDRFNAAHLKKENTMTKEEALAAIKLLSALESWAFSTKNLLPDYLHDDLCVTQKVLEKIVLEKP